MWYSLDVSYFLNVVFNDVYVLVQFTFYVQYIIIRNCMFSSMFPVRSTYINPCDQCDIN